MRNLDGLLAYFTLVKSESDEHSNMYTIKPGYTLTHRHVEEGEEWMDPETGLEHMYIRNEDGVVFLDDDYELLSYADIDLIETSTGRIYDF